MHDPTQSRSHTETTSCCGLHRACTGQRTLLLQTDLQRQHCRILASHPQRRFHPRGESRWTGRRRRQKRHPRAQLLQLCVGLCCQPYGQAPASTMQGHARERLQKRKNEALLYFTISFTVFYQTKHAVPIPYVKRRSLA